MPLSVDNLSGCMRRLQVEGDIAALIVFAETSRLKLAHEQCPVDFHAELPRDFH